MTIDEKNKNLHNREREHHDQWAHSTKLEDILINEEFEAPCAFENKYIMHKIGNLKNKKIIDIGCGLGESSIYFAQHGAHVTAIDISPEMIKVVSTLAEKFNLDINAFVSPAEKINVPENSFDYVYVSNLIHHIHDKKALFKEINRILKKGGEFYSWDPLAYNPVINVYRKIASEVRSEDEYPLKINDIKLIRNYFSVVKIRTFWLFTLILFIKYYFFDRVNPNTERYWKKIYSETNKTLWWWYPFRFLDNIFTKIPLFKYLCWNIVIIGKK